MEVKTICYVVQYAVHMELCSTNLFFLNFLLFIGTFFNKNFIEGGRVCSISFFFFFLIVTPSELKSTCFHGT